MFGGEGGGGAPCGKFVADSVADVHDVKGAPVLLLVDDGANTALVVTSRHHHELPNVELDKIFDFAGFEIVHHGVVHLQTPHRTKYLAFLMATGEETVRSRYSVGPINCPTEIGAFCTSLSP